MERVTVDQDEVVAVELASRVEAEEEGEEAVPLGDKISELSDIAGIESEKEIIAGVEGGIEAADSDATGETQKEEMEDSVKELEGSVVEEAMEDA